MSVTKIVFDFQVGDLVEYKNANSRHVALLLKDWTKYTPKLDTCEQVFEAWYLDLGKKQTFAIWQDADGTYTRLARVE